MGIPGNEHADQQANWGTNQSPCKHATTTRTWAYRQVRASFETQWRTTTQRPLTPKLTYPAEIKHLPPADTTALSRLRCRRTHDDPPPEVPPTPCECGMGARGQSHYLNDCTKYAAARAMLIQATGLATPTNDDTWVPKHAMHFVRFCRRTRLGHSQWTPAPTNPTTNEEEEEVEDTMERAIRFGMFTE